MTTCHCDGPPHTYDPSWCGAGRGDNGRPIAGYGGAAPMNSVERAKSKAYFENAEATLLKLRTIHHRVGRPSIAICSCGLIICPTLMTLEDGANG